MGNFGDFEILRIDGKEYATQAFEVVDGIVKEKPSKYQYISNSEAGSLFKPDSDFDKALRPPLFL